MPPKGTVPRVCARCGVAFLAQKHHIAAGRGRFCGRPCWDAAKRTAADRVCDQCGACFNVHLSTLARGAGAGRFCTLVCWAAAQRTRLERVCRQCGAQFQALPSRVKATGAPYCSNACSAAAHRGADNPNWRGGRSARPDRYVIVRLPDGGRDYEHRVVYAAAYGAIPEGYEVHHRNGVRDDNRLENLLLLSAPQHRAEHGHFAPTSDHPATPSPRSSAPSHPDR